MSLAMAYSVKKRSHDPKCAGCHMCHGGRMAHGGDVKGIHQSELSEKAPKHLLGRSSAGEDLRDAMDQDISEEPYDKKRNLENAKNKHYQVLGQMHAMGKKDRKYLAEGGEVHDDLVDSIMKRYSHGGQVANDTGTGEEADMEPNQFDELVLEDDLEGHYPGSQEHGDAQEDEDRRDIVAQIMRSRRKTDRMPRPA